MGQVLERTPSLIEEAWKRLTLRKSVDDMQMEINENPLNRPLNFFHLNTLGLGAIIGAGIFILSGNVAANFAGPSVIISFLIGSLVAFLAALSYAEMASMVPIAGSSYSYIYTTMGEFCAWLIGWNLCLEYTCAVAAVSVGWSTYVASFIEFIGNTSAEYRILSAPIAWNNTSENFYLTGAYFNLPAMLGSPALLVYNIDVSATFNSIIVVAKIIIILIFIFTAIKYIDPKNYLPFIPKNQGGYKYGVEGLFHGTTVVFFAFIGFDVITTAAQETSRKSQNKLPISIVTSWGISTLLYIGFVSVLVGVVKYDKLADDPIAVVCRAMGLRWLEIMVDVGVICGLTSVILGNLFAQSRILYTMSNDGLLPKIFGHVRHPKQKSQQASPVQEQYPSFLPAFLRAVLKSAPPNVAIIFPTRQAPKPGPGVPFAAPICIGAICAVLAGFLPIDFLAEMTSIGTLFAFLLVHVGVFIMHWTHRDIKRFKIPSKTLFIPVIGVLTCGLLMNSSTKWAKIRFGVWTITGLIIYFSYSKRRSKMWNTQEKRGRVVEPMDNTNALHELVIDWRGIPKQPFEAVPIVVDMNFLHATITTAVE
ncbi:unnamed protein product [Didymodactylos carnosus]|uniref:Amino acid transporter n=1 Tax=Didymodactylos carnosus TaxID=1234261 RepID=A0A8S2ECN7_9BILA|nr:unnamed protein product [Didymodactylos carnosus]CAF3894350.1 unnamed protein product [Didymodactylos carnosus]